MPRSAEAAVSPAARLSEAAFAALVTQCSVDPQRRASLVDWLDESHPAYRERGLAATIRMRGWVLVALANGPPVASALPFLLEELETGKDAYLVAAAARAVRASTTPGAMLAPFVVRAMTNVQEHDDLVSFDAYGGSADTGSGTSAVAELLATLRWLGPRARGVAPELTRMLGAPRRGELSPARQRDLRATLRIIDDPAADAGDASCCTMPAGFGARIRSRDGRTPVRLRDDVQFEDHDGEVVTARDLFHGQPTVVAFFYTRCENPRKCSLSIAKLAGVQRLLRERGLAGHVRIAAITYDPGWDSADRLRGYALNRGVRLDASCRMLRVLGDDMSHVQAHFQLGVSYVESLVTRHRVEAFILDADGDVAVAFERALWDASDVVDRVTTLLASSASPGRLRQRQRASTTRAGALEAWMPLPALLAAILPKCPLCWAAYLSAVGMAGLENHPVTAWVFPAIFATMIVNVSLLYWRARVTGNPLPLVLGLVGAIAIILLGYGLEIGHARSVGVVLTAWASVISVTDGRRRGRARTAGLGFMRSGAPASRALR